MKLLGKVLNKDGSGSVRLIPEEIEDMWHAYYLISKNSLVTASTFRKVQSKSDTRSSASPRAQTTLTIQVKHVDYDPQACLLRITGRNVRKNKFVTMGVYHTLKLEINREFKLTKVWWDSNDLDRIENACDPAQRADLAAVVMHEGLAHVCLVLPSIRTILLREKINEPIPRKRQHVSSYEKGLQHFYESVTQAVLRHVNFDIVKCVLIASPIYSREELFDYMFQQAERLDNKLLLDNKHKFVLIYASSGFKHSLHEALLSPGVQVKIADTKATAEMKELDIFHTTLESQPEKAFYGLEQVEKAHHSQAIETLWISDSLLKECNVLTRKQYAELIEGVKQCGGNVKIFSRAHASGERLTQLKGIAALSRFSIPEMEEKQDETDKKTKNCVTVKDEDKINRLNMYVKYLFRK